MINTDERQRLVMQEWQERCVPWVNMITNNRRGYAFSRLWIYAWTANAIAVTYPNLSPEGKHKLLLAVRDQHRAMLELIPRRWQRLWTTMTWQLLTEVLVEEELLMVERVN